jgi:CBS domain-containing protein
VLRCGTSGIGIAPPCLEGRKYDVGNRVDLLTGLRRRGREISAVKAMGSAITKHQAYHSLQQELDGLTIAQVLNLVQKDQSFMDINRTTVGPETLVSEAVDLCAKNPSGAVPVMREGKIIAVLDLPLVLDYLLCLFSDATEKREVVDVVGINSPDYGMGMGYGGAGYGMMGGGGYGVGGFHAFMQVREKSFVTSYAGGVMNRGSNLFGKETVEELLGRTSKKKAIPDIEHSVALTTPVRTLLQRWVNDRSNSVCVFAPNSELAGASFGFLNEIDALHLVEKLLAKHELDLQKVKIKRLGLGKKEPQMVKSSTRVMHCFKVMQSENISALPIVSPADPDKIGADEKKDMVLRGEFSLHAMQHLNHDTLQLILTSVNEYLYATDTQKKWSSPLTCSRRDTLHDVLTQMHVARRVHVWCVSKKRRVKGVVSLTDIMRLLFEHTATK